MITETFIYKRIGACELRADIHLANRDRARPVIVWLHPGALMFGSRQMIQPAHVARYVSAGHAVVAIDYRLAPETKLPEILQDIHDAITWVRAEGSRLFAADAERVALVGHSAGGYLTLLAGCTVQPRPQALVAFYGYGDIVGTWYSEPSPFYCQQPMVGEEEARAGVNLTPCPGSSGADGGIASADTPGRRAFYLYCRQQGCWPREATGLDPIQDRSALAPFCPVQRVTADFPPTLLLHGNADTDVPYEQSVLMARALTGTGIPHEVITIAGGEHGFDWRQGDPVVDAAFARVIAFLGDHLQPVRS